MVISALKLYQNHSEIARRMNITRHTVISILSKYKESKSVSNAPGQGRKRKLSDADIKEMAKEAKKKSKCAPELAQRYSFRTRKHVSESTVQRRLREQGLAYLTMGGSNSRTEGR